MNITSTYKVHVNKGTKEGIVRFVSVRPTQKDHVTNEEVKSCNNRKIQEIISEKPCNHIMHKRSCNYKSHYTLMLVCVLGLNIIRAVPYTFCSWWISRSWLIQRCIYLYMVVVRSHCVWCV